MTEYILVPLDGSALAESALPLDIALARQTSSGVLLLRAVPPCASQDEELSAARDYLDNIGKYLEEGGLQVRTEIVEETPATAIVEYAEQYAGVWLIAMATRHYSPSGPWAFDSVAGRVLHTTHKPVLLTRPSIDASGSFPKKDEERTGLDKDAREHIPTLPPFHTIIVPLDGSRLAEEAIEQARRLALPTGATLVLVSAIPPGANRGVDQVELIRISADVARDYEAARLGRYLSDTAVRLRADGLQVLTELAYGHPAETILRVARRLNGDPSTGSGQALILLAAHGRRDFERLWLGSVAQKLVQGSTLPLLLMRPTGPQPVSSAADSRLVPVC